jgi:hypothetical protein
MLYLHLVCDGGNCFWGVSCETDFPPNSGCCVSIRSLVLNEDFLADSQLYHNNFTVVFDFTILEL